METHDGQEIKDQVHIVLRGPDGKIKDERDIQVIFLWTILLFIPATKRGIIEKESKLTSSRKFNPILFNLFGTRGQKQNELLW